MKKTFYIKILLLFFIGLFVIPTHSQQKVEFKIEKVNGNVFCLYGAGGNIGILKGEKQLLLVDAQYAKTAQEALTKIRTVSNLPIKYLINTHYHGDHTSGNPILGKGAQILSHKNCKSSLLRGLKQRGKTEVTGVPQKIFNKEKTLQVGKESVRLLHFGPGHTSGDTVVIFEKSKVIHAGDLFFNGIPPYIDVKDGSDTQNWILTIKKLSKKYPDFKIIPGHGPVTNIKEFLKFAQYLQYLRKEVTAAIKAGKTREETMGSINMEPYNHLKDKGTFLTKKANIGWIYDEITRK